jgi:energy-coupling factor transporter transmembrane protein EcfT
VWGSWNYAGRPIGNPPSGFGGCFSQIFTIIAVLIGLFFLINLFPFLLIFVGFYILIVLIGIFAPYLKWIFRILGIILLIAFFGSLFKTCSSSTSHYNPNPLVVDAPREINPPVIVPVAPVDTNLIDTIQKPIKDSIISRYRSWKDYSGKSYEGKYQIRLSNFKNAHYNKNSLNISQNTIKSYDGIVFNLKEFDKNNINSVFRLFDSIGKANKLNKIKFAEMIVTFVQDIPYAIVLQNGCDASLYNDQFTRNYLLNHSGECDGGQRFGINTPVEFLVNLKGDCDTRTLLLYTIFSHYNYDVALMSSEFYGHSIIGINLPIAGSAYTYNNQRYVMWETTAPNCKAGVIPNEISNLNNWRISLKSK